MDIPAYLARLEYSKTPSPDLEALNSLQLAHLLAVPFENLDIGLGRRIQLSEPALWRKIVLSRRGGFCYELNGLFAWLLRELGFGVSYLNARVFNREGRLGIDFDHLALLVEVPDLPGRWLTDVGFGDSFMQPLDLQTAAEQPQGLRAYRIEKSGDGHVVWQRNYEGVWERQYFFDLQPRAFPRDYEAASVYHQTSPLSSFTRGSIISRATLNGRVSLEDGRLIVTQDGRREERAVTGRAEYEALLREYFGVVL